MYALLTYLDTLIFVSVSDIIFQIVLPSSSIIIPIRLSGIKIFSITSLEPGADLEHIKGAEPS